LLGGTYRCHSCLGITSGRCGSEGAAAGFSV
jgi:hypothetical protein